MNDNKTLVFVYGTLKRGQINHNILQNEEFMTCAITEEHYSMHHYGNFPILIENEPRANIHGELYRVSDAILESMDFLESNGEFYERKLIKLSGIVEPVWCYFTICYERDDTANDTAVSMDINDVQDWKPL